MPVASLLIYEAISGIRFEKKVSMIDLRRVDVDVSCHVSWSWSRGSESGEWRVGERRGGRRDESGGAPFFLKIRGQTSNTAGVNREQRLR